MKDTAPKELGILAVAALFGLVALVVAWAVLNYTGFASFLIGAIVAIITAIALWFGWREPASGPTGPRDLSPSNNDTDAQATSGGIDSAGGKAAAAAAPAAAFASTASAAPAAKAAAPAAKPAAKAAKPAAKAAKPAAKAAKPAAKAAKPAAKAASTSAKAAKPAAKATKPAAKAAKPAAAKAAKPAAKAAKPAAKAAKPAAAKASSAKAARPVAADGKPETLTKARAGGADDLKQIKGVGPGLEKTLNEMGFYHFDQVAGWRKKEIEWVDSRLKFKGRIERDEWIKQCKTLAKGGSTEFSKKVKKGGVY